MKDCTVNFIIGNQGNCDGFLLESLSDLNAYKDHLMDEAAKLTERFIVSSYKYFDGHFIGSLAGEQRAMAECAGAANRSAEPIDVMWAVSEGCRLKLLTLKNMLMDGNTVFMNKEGGVCSIAKGIVEIVETRPFTFFGDNDEKCRLADGVVITLENDQELEEPAVKYMEERWGQFSYILDLRAYDAGSLQNIFSGFRDRGGKTVYVRTTGKDINQMYVYAGAALTVGINDFVFDFKEGQNDEIRKFILWLSKLANVEVI